MAKFHFLCDDLLGEDRASTVVATIERLDGLSDVRELTSLL